MLSYRILNNITGWFCFAVAFCTYLLTAEPTASFWDCGEFIAAADKLQVGHPPGAPMFLLMARLFAMLAPSPDKVAWMVNAFSALLSAFTILFLCWSITHIGFRVSGSGFRVSGSEFRVPGKQDLKPETRNPKPGTRNPKPETQNPEPGTRNSELGTRNPKPETS